jgi:hypothetical protein
VRVLLGAGAERVTAVEVDPAREAELRGLGPRVRSTCADFLAADPLSLAADLVITNPPFSRAEAFVRHALAATAPGGTTALLLRLSFLAGGKRAALFRASPPDIYVLSTRPSFAAVVTCAADADDCGWKGVFDIGSPTPKKCPACGGPVSKSTSDSSEYAWFVWGPGRGNRWHVLSKP